jgi:chromosome segregation ATPase
MSTLDVLNAIGEAHAALIRVPELEATIKSLTDERDFIKLERDEAELTISRLKARIVDLENFNAKLGSDLLTADRTITELTTRNANLDQSHNDLAAAHSNALSSLYEKDLTIEILRSDKAALAARLEDAKGYGVKLSETLRSIGQSIVAAVEVPEVTPSAPFPVSNPVELPLSTEPEVDSSVDNRLVEPVASPAPADLVEPAAGCFPYRYW